ncbi:MAG: rhomboid family intramembrane serine protease, partial [Clostridium sp.]|nr:rhomboid family intramembrane serine protease [Clostridium sp.]
MKNSTRELMENMCRSYNYKIVHFDIEKECLWGLIRQEDGNSRLFIFLEYNEVKILDYAISEVKANGYSSFVKVFVAKKIKKIDLLNERSIVIDPEKGDLLYASQDVYNCIDDIKNILKLKKDNLIENNWRNFIATYLIIAANVIVFLITVYFSNNIMDINTNVLEMMGAKDNALILNGQYYRLFTSMFLHSGLIHISMNMYSLYILGKLVEKFYGRSRYVFIYFLSGICASILSFIMTPQMSVGASGAIFGILGATL